ncbi:MAG: hypothetical protein JJU37_01235 [Balneolaceae bacterium]|nr:hypothetical protein [Balneolaceae bacterium]
MKAVRNREFLSTANQIKKYSPLKAFLIVLILTFRRLKSPESGFIKIILFELLKGGFT